MSKNIPNIPIAKLDSMFNDLAFKSLSDQLINADVELLTTTETKARTIWEAGYKFEDMLEGNNHFTPFPKVVSNICESALLTLKSQYGEDLPPTENFTNCIISQYNNGSNSILKYHVDMHKDHPYARGKSHNFYWGEDIIGVVLRSDPGKKGARLCLQPPDENGRAPTFNYNAAVQIPEEDGMVFLLRGDARNKWFHGVKDGKGNRLSLTYRSVEFT